MNACKIGGGEYVKIGWEGLLPGQEDSACMRSCACTKGAVTSPGVPELVCKDDAAVTSRCKPKQCLRTDNTLVDDGASFPGLGGNWCNKCTCMNGLVACTRRACENEKTPTTGVACKVDSPVFKQYATNCGKKYVRSQIAWLES